jgi:hypothetical protein
MEHIWSHYDWHQKEQLMDEEWTKETWEEEMEEVDGSAW